VGLRCALLAVVLAAVSAGGCGVAARNPAGPSEFSSGFLELRYPPTWIASQPGESRELHVQPLLYVSRQPTRNACRTRGMVTSCGWPLTELQPGGVLVVWENRGYPGWSLSAAPGRALRVGGRRARIQRSRPGACAAIHGDETISVAIERPLAGNWTSVTACLRAPGLARVERGVELMLRSARFRSP
jgi:hypothetical protein